MARPKRSSPPPAATPPSAATAAATSPQRLQMADVARMAGVSVSTVSRALSGSPLVNAETRERIGALARNLRYTVNVGAQNLRLKQNRTVSVVVPFDATSREHLSDPFFLTLIGSIADALTDSGHDMLLSRIDAEQLQQAAETHQTGRAAGVILIGQWHHHDQLNQMAVQGVPLVVWGARLPDQLYATVGTDNMLGGRLATEHLLGLGKRHIAFIGDRDLPEVGQRHAGYLQAHRERGLAADEALTLKAPFVSQRVQHDLEAFVASGAPLDGIVASSDLSAMAAINTLRQLGRRVPEDVAVVGYDDIPLAAHFNPSLTTVRQPIAQAGQALVALLLAQLGGQKAVPVLLPTELVPRESTAVPARAQVAAPTKPRPRKTAR